ncbi:hypothetical protein CGRA01v4_02720 [Colletotrichum graminicola]|nr:hypothetical protein CGRA01v4_02720 [Colletotrichum graminicola]
MTFFDRTMAKSYKRSNTPPFTYLFQVASNVKSSCFESMIVVRTSLHHKKLHIPRWFPFIVSSQFQCG